MPLRKWTPEQIAEMQALAHMGRSYAEIVETFGTTRSAISGVIRCSQLACCVRPLPEESSP